MLIVEGDPLFENCMITDNMTSDGSNGVPGGLFQPPTAGGDGGNGGDGGPGGPGGGGPSIGVWSGDSTVSTDNVTFSLGEGGPGGVAIKGANGAPGIRQEIHRTL